MQFWIDPRQHVASYHETWPPPAPIKSLSWAHEGGTWLVWPPRAFCRLLGLHKVTKRVLLISARERRKKEKKGDHTLSSSFHRKSYRIRLFFSSTYGGRAWPLGGSRVLGRHPDSPPSRTLRLPKARKQRGRWREKMTLPTTTTRVVSSKVRWGRHAHTEGGGSAQDEIKGETFG